MTQMITRASDTAGRSPEDYDALDELAGVDGLAGGRTVSGFDVGDRLWRLFINMRTGLFLILLLGAWSFIGTMLEQAPAGMRADQQAYAAWLESIHPKYGGWTVVFDRLGLFHVFSSWWFKGTLVLLCASILACSVNRAPLLWRLATRPRVRKGDAFFTHAPLRAQVHADTDPQQALAAARTVLRRAHFRVLDGTDHRAPVASTPATSRVGGALYADRFRFGPIGTVIAHVSFVVILVGAVLSATTGFKDTEFTVPQGAQVRVGHGSGLSLQLKEFTDSYYADGAPRDYASDMVLYKHGKVVKTQTVRVNQPLRYDGISFFQSFFGVAAAVRATDRNGAALFDRGVPLAYASDDGTHSIGQFDIPAKKLYVYVITPASGQIDPNIKAGQVQLEIHRTGQDDPIATEVISQGKPTTIDGVEYTFRRPLQFTGLIVSRDRGASVVWIGSFLLVLGIVMVFFFPHRRIWLQVTPAPGGGSDISAAATMRRDPAFEPRFARLAADLERSLSAAPDPPDDTHPPGNSLDG